MPLPRRTRGPAQLAKLEVDMAAGDVPNDKEQVLVTMSKQEHPPGCSKCATAWAASQTAERRSEIVRRAAEVRWSK